ncbi:MAG: aminoglycoside phosphotransferase family protein [Deltaproteobacteria bacterium]
MIKGTPEGLGFDELDELCKSGVGNPLQSVSYCALSGWKKSGAFRLLLQTEAGDKWSIIYKNALYRQDIIPALNSFPINPGPPEYRIYSRAEGGITKYLPKIYMCREVISGLHYKYLMEDLNKHYRPARNKKDILYIASELAELYDKIGECNYSLSENLFIIYDRDLSSRLKTYIIEGLERYTGATKTSAVSTLCDNWEGISSLYDEKYEYSGLNTIIHGDSNLANILVHKQNDGTIKFIDWEWAGIGLPHQDLASLLKRARPEVEEAALEIFSKNDRSLSAGEHQRLYEVCQLERGLIDCAFLANQVAGSADKTKIDIKGYIEDSALRAVEAYNRLSRGL